MVCSFVVDYVVGKYCLYSILPELHQWCNDKHASRECGSSWVRTPSYQIKHYTIGVCLFTTKHTPLRKKSTDGLTRNDDIVS